MKKADLYKLIERLNPNWLQRKSKVSNGSNMQKEINGKKSITSKKQQ
jgi:hypothetical protein